MLTYSHYVKHLMLKPKSLTHDFSTSSNLFYTGDSEYWII